MTAWSDDPAAVHQGLWTEYVRRTKGPPSLAQVRHPGYAWHATLDPLQGLDSQAQAAANAYLAALAVWVPTLAKVVNVLRASSARWAWLPITWGLGSALPQDLSPTKSFLLTRGDPDDWREASLVLLAARGLNGKALGNGVGLRVTAHVQRDADSAPWQLRFASISGAGLEQADASLPPWMQALGEPEPALQVRIRLERVLDVRHPAVHSLRPSDDGQSCCLEGVAVRVRPKVPGEPETYAPRARVYGFSVQLQADSGDMRIQSFQELSSQMQRLYLFERDPASVGAPDLLDGRQPGGSESNLDLCREYRTQAPRTMRGAEPEPLQQADANANALFVVTHQANSATRISGAASVAADKKRAALPRFAPRAQDPLLYLPLRSDDLAAAQAYLQAKALFDRLQSYGFNVRHYFRHARLPLELRPRARLPGAFDGRTVNAEVRPFYRNSVPSVDLFSDDKIAPFDDGQRPQLLVRLGSADTKVRQGVQTLGLAADPRWAWHEFGHVLNFAATGELEFAFAHSAGDALAAITADPDSGLAVHGELRGQTFPWVFVPRRHDRQALQGYCWCGARSRLQLQSATVSHHRHGYFEEQLLSSSLFRLYLSLGGATGPVPAAGGSAVQAQTDLDIRRSASDYCVYLIMRAIALLGPNGVVAANTADQFVGALIDADLGTGQWLIQAPWPYRENRLRAVRRHGGRAHKVIRWAFEQQGLYACDGPGKVAEGPGQPPPVDVFLADRRGAAPGGYSPVPLRWDAQGQGPWYADPEALSRSTGGWLTARVSQRGRLHASDMSLRLWVSPAHDGPLQWQALEPVQAGSQAATQGKFSAQCLGHDHQPLWVLAAAHASADPCNLPAHQAPPSDLTELTELVANDNNLALAFLPNPGLG